MHTYMHLIFSVQLNVFTPGRRQSKTPILSRNVDKKSIETVFSIAICRHTGDKWESKTLFLSIFDPLSSFVDNVFDCRLPGVVWCMLASPLPGSHIRILSDETIHAKIFSTNIN